MVFAMLARTALSALFLSTIPAANWLIGHVGTVCLSDAGPCLVPVWPWPPLLAPSGSLAIGLALLARNGLQQIGTSRGMILVLIGIGAGISAMVAPAALTVASATAFTTSELADWSVYGPLRKRHLTWAVLAAGMTGAVVDATVFIYLAFGSAWDLVPGQVVAKWWASVIAAGMIWFWQRRRGQASRPALAGFRRS
jgi:hypothetical protein